MLDDELLFGGDFFDLESELSSEAEKLQLREGELREVAMLFADIKGFSSISNLFDAETIHKKMDELMKIFSRCISFYGGFVDKYMGDGIMALFGAKQASEQDTERAIMAAIKMQQQLKVYNKLLRKQSGFEAVELGLRIGINSGLVSVGKVGADREGDFTVYGPEVNLASRMESNAPVNKIMLPLSTMKQVTRSFEFESVGAVSVKGFDEPIECYTVLSPKLEGSLHHRNHSTRFIGREKELAQLHDCLNQTSVVNIKGEAGQGKTRLVYEFERSVKDSAVFLHGACSAISPAPLNLFSSILEFYFQVQLNEAPDVKLNKLDVALSQLGKDMDGHSKQEIQDMRNLLAFLLEVKLDDPRLKQNGTDLLNHLFIAVECLIAYVARKAKQADKPLVIVLDDLHWLDEASGRVLENILYNFSHKEDSPVIMWVLMSRMEYLLPSYMANLGRICELSLSPLDQDEIRLMLQSQTKGKSITDDALDKVILLSEGNPFYLEEWCNYIESIPANELRDFPVPANLHSLIQTRLDRLPVALRMLLYKASVIGHDFFVDILRYIESRLNEPMHIEATLSSLEEQSLIFKSLGFDYSAYFFKHITTREVAYQTLLLENRKVLHQLCGEAIEQLYPERLDEFYFVLANHFQKAEIKDKALLYLEKAASSAARIYNNAQALDMYNIMLAYTGLSDAKRLDIRLKISDIKWLTGQWQQAIPEVHSILSAAQTLDDPQISFSAHRFLGIASFYKQDLDTALIHLNRAKEIADDLDDTMLSCIAMGNLSNWYFQKQDFMKANALQRESLELAKQIGDYQRQAKSLSNLGMIALANKDYEQAEKCFIASLEIAQTNRLLKEESIALGNLGFTKIQQKDFVSAMPLLTEKLKLAEQMNDYQELLKVLGNISAVHREQGEKQTALLCLERIHTLKLQSKDFHGAEQTAMEIKELSQAE